MHPGQIEEREMEKRTIQKKSTLYSILLFLLFGSALCSVGCGQKKNRPSLLRVYAASSLNEAFHDLEREFELAHPNIDVSLVFAGSQILRLQIQEGAHAHVYASANAQHVQALADSGRLTKSTVFAHNKIALIVPKDNPAQIDSLSALSSARRFVLGTQDVPVGRYARQVLKQAGSHFGTDFENNVLSNIASEESNARLVRAKVEMGEADAALVYRTDALTSDRVRVVSIPDDLNLRADYFIGLVGAPKDASAGHAWINFLGSEKGKTILIRHGFEVN
jgi:molybdate transport system substrate-binding protein